MPTDRRNDGLEVGPVRSDLRRSTNIPDKQSRRVVIGAHTGSTDTPTPQLATVAKQPASSADSLLAATINRFQCPSQQIG
jgi:hypothetical protein